MKFFLLLLVAILANLTTARNPGLTLKLSEAGLDYAAKVAVDKLSADVRSRKIPNFSGSSGRLRYEISNIRITRFTSPGSSVTTDSHNGITMTLRNVGISVNGNWRYQWRKAFIRIRDHGSFDLSVSGVTLRLSLGMGVDSAGRPTLWIKSRDTHIGNVRLRFHGGASWLYNMFSRYTERKIASKLRSSLNDALDDLINQKAKKTLQQMKVRIPVKDITTLDYRLVAAPEIAANYIKSSHKGEFFWTEDNTGNPALPPPIEDLSGTSKMVTLCMSDYVSNSLGYVLYKRGQFLLRYNLTESDLPGAVRDVLRLDKYPELAKGESSGMVHLLMYATEPPTLHTDKNGIKGCIRGTIDVKMTEPTGELITLLSLDLTADIAIVGRMTGERITGHVQHLRLTTNITRPRINPQTTEQINTLLTSVSEYFLVPNLNDVGKIGYPVPNLDDVKFINPQLHLLKDTVCVSTDVKYEP